VATPITTDVTGLGHRLQGVEVTTPVEGMPPRVEIVVRPGRIVSVQSSQLDDFRGVNAIVVVWVGTVEDDLAVPDDQHAIDVPILSAFDLGIQLVSRWKSG